MRRVGHRVWWSGARHEADTQALRRVVGPIPGPHRHPRRKDGDAQVRGPRFRVGRAPNSWFGGGLQSMTTFPDAGVFSMIATAG
jgi:hypothetical protein